MKHLRNLDFFCAIPVVEFVGLLLKKCFSEGSRNRVRELVRGGIGVIFTVLT
ncbi:hypothetical protein C900_04312 [Fulvivirga imtechensis AK7]|uniref:Uncharacterized protein n=1 Tax=Fulvivirga imtechensis AK7 TaxID=1237149 RepID=L8JXD9_9BACT|nr:hypothetical protein C900_04312 [Fulvivirga imtechensis AK7]